ncbi:hypothetical protein FQZ97_1205720 [compost metagenome]
MRRIGRQSQRSLREGHAQHDGEGRKEEQRQPEIGHDGDEATETGHGSWPSTHIRAPPSFRGRPQA